VPVDQPAPQWLKGANFNLDDGTPVCLAAGDGSLQRQRWFHEYTERQEIDVYGSVRRAHRKAQLAELDIPEFEVAGTGLTHSQMVDIDEAIAAKDWERLARLSQEKRGVDGDVDYDAMAREFYDNDQEKMARYEANRDAFKARVGQELVNGGVKFNSKVLAITRDNRNVEELSVAKEVEDIAFKTAAGVAFRTLELGRRVKTIRRH